MSRHDSPAEAMAAWTKATDKAQAIKSEVGDIRRLIADGNDPDRYEERLGNLSRGLDRATEEVKTLGPILGEMFGAGLLGTGEPGDGHVEPNRHRKALGANPSPLAEAMLGAKFDLKSRPSVEVDGYATLKSVTAPAPTSWSRPPRELVAAGQDRRWLWPHLPMENAGEHSAIEDYSQTSRTVTGTVERAVTAATDKAELAVELELVTEQLSQLAIVISDIPNQLLESIPKLAAWLGTEGEFQLHSALDDHAFAQIVAAAPPFGTTGSTLIEQVRNGVGAMRATGAAPSLLVVNPSDAATLDLATDSGGFVFPTSNTGTSSPLWGLQVVERIGAGTEPPYLIDPARLGALYAGRLKFEADPYTGFKKNLTDLRIEVNALFHVRDANGARRIAAT